MGNCIGAGHLWAWAANPDCKIPEGTPCDCGLMKYGQQYECPNCQTETSRADRAEKEAFGLAATQCSDPIAHEHGSMICGAVEEQKRLRLKAEQERDHAEADNVALVAVLTRIHNWNEHDPLADCAMRQFAGEVINQPHPGSRYLELAQIVEGWPKYGPVKTYAGFTNNVKVYGLLLDDKEATIEQYRELADALARLLKYRQEMK